MPQLVFADLGALQDIIVLHPDEILGTYPQATLIEVGDVRLGTLEAAGISVTFPGRAPLHLVSGPSHWGAVLRGPEVGPLGEAAPDLYLVRFPGPLTAEWRKGLFAAAEVVIGALTPGVYMVKAAAEALRRLQVNRRPVPFRWLRPELRLHPLVTEASVAAVEGQVGKMVEITVTSPDSAHGVVVVGAGMFGRDRVAPTQIKGRPELRGHIGAGTLAALSTHPDVVAIVPFVAPTLHASLPGDIIGLPLPLAGGSLAAGPDAGLRLDGDGEIVAVADFGFVQPGAGHPLDGVVVKPIQDCPPASWALLGNVPSDGTDDNGEGHGTHIIGCVAMRPVEVAGIGTVRGTAPAATVLVQAIGHKAGAVEHPCAGVPAKLGELLDRAFGAQARIHCNAWGSSTEVATYGAWAAQLDEWCFANRESLVIFSAGNDGMGTITCPGTAKNALTVGASETEWLNKEAHLPPKWSRSWPDTHAAHLGDRTDSVADSDVEPAACSGGGPVASRVKPELAAPGINILSAARVGGPVSLVTEGGEHLVVDPRFRWGSGASQATAVTAGVAASLRGALRSVAELFPAGVGPSSALLKALLVNESVQPWSGWPDAQFGWGRLLLTGFGPGAVRPDFQDSMDLALHHGEEHSFTFSRLDSSKSVSVTLTWTDAPSTASSGALRNALHIRVVTATGEVVGLAAHHTQRIVIHPTGSFQVKVIADAVTAHRPCLAVGAANEPRQDYALVVSNARVTSADKVSIEQWASRRVPTW